MRVVLVVLVTALAGCAGPQGAVQEPPTPSTAPSAPPSGTALPTTTTTTPPTTLPPSPPREPLPTPPTPEGGSARQLNVSMQGRAFTPSDVMVEPGSTVTWTNLDPFPHNIVLDDGSKRAGPVQKGEHAALTFPANGSFVYYCELHANMTGVVRVQELPPVAPPPAPAGHFNVTIAGRSFDPHVLRVSVGSTIVWTNRDHEWHEAEADAGSWFSSGLLQPGQAYTIVADRAGTFSYRCDLHSMKGTLIVE